MPGTYQSSIKWWPVVLIKEQEINIEIIIWATSISSMDPLVKR